MAGFPSLGFPSDDEGVIIFYFIALFYSEEHVLLHFCQHRWRTSSLSMNPAHRDRLGGLAASGLKVAAAQACDSQESWY
jgi:hypothetical protein